MWGSFLLQNNKRSAASTFDVCLLRPPKDKQARSTISAIMYLQSVTFILLVVLAICVLGQTDQTAAASASATTTSATTTTSSSGLDSLSGNVFDEISAYFAHLLPSATASPAPVEINEALDIIVDGRIYPPVIYDGSVPM